MAISRHEQLGAVKIELDQNIRDARDKTFGALAMRCSRRDARDEIFATRRTRPDARDETLDILHTLENSAERRREKHRKP
jgi:hypothetical protein